ncbi:repeat-containing protein [Zobellia uliginosa]|uniref:Repeat-containing protein n=1 Tax=Zobellia uliginosa TaxID=143224 RepID=A0ABY1KMC6_9FLAO|nr:SwmB domain-containing protein [Zobellia uliginosa]SIS49242.1 repeat-containing protein [Zobellia uliginosa]
MRDIKYSIRFLFLLLIIVGCEDDDAYVAPNSFVDAAFTTTWGTAADKDIDINNYGSFMDLSNGTVKHEWTIPEGTFFLKGPLPTNADNFEKYIIEDAGKVSEEGTVHVLFTKGDSLTPIKLHNEYEEYTEFALPTGWDTETNSTIIDTLKTVKKGSVWVLDYTLIIDVYDTIVADMEIRNMAGNKIDFKNQDVIDLKFGDQLIFEDLSRNNNTSRPNSTVWTIHTIAENKEDEENIINVNEEKTIDTLTFNKRIGQFKGRLISKRERTETVQADEETYEIPVIFNVAALDEALEQSGEVMELADNTIVVPVSSKLAPLTEDVSSHFSVKVNGVKRPVATVAQNPTNAAQLWLTLATPLEGDDAVNPVTVSYDGGNATLKSIDERLLEAFTDVVVEVYVPVPVLRVGTAQKQTADDAILLQFDQELDPASITASADATMGFSATVNGVASGVSSVEVDATDPSILKLYLNEELYRDDEITISYVAPGDIRSIGAGELSDFGPDMVVADEDNILGDVGMFESAIGSDWLNTGSTGTGAASITAPPTPDSPSTVAPSGNVMHLSAPDGNKPNTITSGTYPFEAGVVYRVKFKRYLGSTTTTAFAKHFFGNQQVSDNWNDTEDELGKWQSVEFTFTAASTTNGTVRIQPVPAGISDVYYDDYIIQVDDNRP